MKIIICGNDSKKKKTLYNLMMEGLKKEKTITHEGYAFLDNPKIILNPDSPSFLTVNFNTDRNIKLLLKDILEFIPVKTSIMDKLFNKYNL